MSTTLQELTISHVVTDYFFGLVCRRRRRRRPCRFLFQFSLWCVRGTFCLDSLVGTYLNLQLPTINPLFMYWKSYFIL